MEMVVTKHCYTCFIMDNPFEWPGTIGLKNNFKLVYLSQLTETRSGNQMSGRSSTYL